MAKKTIKFHIHFLQDFYSCAVGKNSWWTDFSQSTNRYISNLPALPPSATLEKSPINNHRYFTEREEGLYSEYFLEHGQDKIPAIFVNPLLLPTSLLRSARTCWYFSSVLKSSGEICRLCDNLINGRTMYREKKESTPAAISKDGFNTKRANPLYNATFSSRVLVSGFIYLKNRLSLINIVVPCDSIDFYVQQMKGGANKMNSQKVKQDTQEKMVTIELSAMKIKQLNEMPIIDLELEVSKDKNWLIPRLRVGKPFHVNYVIKVLESMGYTVKLNE
jgi:hypothetical protein